MDEADRQSLINLLKERPDLLKDLNKTFGEILEKAEVDRGEIDLEELFRVVMQSLDES